MDIDNSLTLKFVLLGNLGVGKRSIVRKFVDNVFDDYARPRTGEFCNYVPASSANSYRVILQYRYKREGSPNWRENCGVAARVSYPLHETVPISLRVVLQHTYTVCLGL